MAHAFQDISKNNTAMSQISREEENKLDLSDYLNELSFSYMEIYSEEQSLLELDECIQELKELLTMVEEKHATKVAHGL